MIDLNDVFEFRIGDDGHGSLKDQSKFQHQTHQAEVVVLAQIGSEIESVKYVSVVLASDIESLVGSKLSSSGKHRVVHPYILSVSKVWFYGSDSVLLLTVQVEHYLVQIKMLKVVRVKRSVAIKRAIVDQSDDYVCGQLTRKQFLVVDIQIIPAESRTTCTPRDIWDTLRFRIPGLWRARGIPTASTSPFEQTAMCA